MPRSKSHISLAFRVMRKHPIGRIINDQLFHEPEALARHRFGRDFHVQRDGRVRRWDHRLVLGPELQWRHHEARRRALCRRASRRDRQYRRLRQGRPRDQAAGAARLGHHWRPARHRADRGLRCPEIPAVLPRRLRAAERQDRSLGLCALQGRTRLAQWHGLFAALRLRRHRLLLPLRHSRRGRLQRRWPRRHHLEWPDRDRQGYQGQDRADPVPDRPQWCRHLPHHDAVRRFLVFQRRWQREHRQ